LTDGPYAGQTVAELAQRLGKPYEKVMIDDLGYGGPGQAHFLMAAAVQDLFITADHICFSTDGAPGAHHPRAAASFVKVLEEYVGAPPKMSLERAVHKMSGLAADIIGLTDRGVLATGKKADILVLSPADLHSRASWLKPQLRPSGIDAILVNGQFALDQGQVSSSRHGRLLRSDRRRHA
jgi:N-acyl-D-amino-acid deacylase